MTDEPDEVEPGSNQDDYFESGADSGKEASEDEGTDEIEEGPEWRPGQFPGIDAYLRSVFAPAFRQLEDFNRIGRFVQAAMPQIEPPRVSLPKITLAPDITRSLLDVDEMLEPWREAVAAMADWREVAHSVRTVAPTLTDLLARQLPPNWSEVQDWRTAARFVEETGWAIIWLPSADIVTALIKAPRDAREAVLLEQSKAIIDDAVACAREVRHEQLTFIADCIIEVGECIGDGRHRAAQALAASILTELIQGILGFDKLAHARTEYDEPWEEKSIRLLRFALITSTIPQALERFYPEKGDPVPASFNRHAVAHGANPIQFTAINALVGLMLVAALTRELQKLFDEGVLDDDDDGDARSSR